MHPRDTGRGYQMAEERFRNVSHNMAVVIECSKSEIQTIGGVKPGAPLRPARFDGGCQGLKLDVRAPDLSPPARAGLLIPSSTLKRLCLLAATRPITSAASHGELYRSRRSRRLRPTCPRQQTLGR